ncbi:MAG: response regulator, partial [Anaerolineales bacterium]|nr:response regulator [Anaerolineales bacterium]
FEPFFTTKSPGRGAGLGLAQVYGIVQQHNGHIHVATKLASGTTVTIYFPAYSRSDADDFPVESVTVVRGHEETILVVEDNELAREALVSSLERLNYRVLAAQNGREALQLFAQHRLEVQLVLSDVVMPDMDGLALLRALRQQTTSVPVLMLTGHPLEDRLETLRQAGMSDWLLKPVGLPQLAQMISQLLLRAA